MLSRSVGLGASLALAANAILLPPGVSFDTTTAEDIASTWNLDPTRNIVQVECPGCPFAEFGEDNRMIWTNGVENSLIFEFETGKDRSSFSLNGAQLFPLQFGSIPPRIHIPQRAKDEHLELHISEHSRRPVLLVTAYDFRVDPARTVSESGNEILPMTLTIHSITHLSIPAQTFSIYVIKDVEGRLHLVNIQPSVEDEVEQPKPDEERKECNDWPTVCKWKAILATKLDRLKGSLRKPGCPKMVELAHGKDPHSDGLHGGPLVHDMPHHTSMSHPHHMHDGRLHHPHRHHNKSHRFTHMLSQAMRDVLIPILVGVAAGLITYLVGTIIGMTVALIWLKIRSRRAQYQPIALDEEDAAGVQDIDAKHGKEVIFIEEISETENEAPPAYSDLDEKEVVDAPVNQS